MKWTLALFVLASFASARPVLAQCPDGSPPPCTRAARAAAPAPTSVAVLYFDNLSRDTNDTYLAEGLTDELITRLGQLERLQVKSRNAVRRFRGDAAEDPAAVGRALNVAHLVSGSVRRTGSGLRITVELTRAATGAHLWGDVIERRDQDMMTVESEVARAIAEAVGGRLAPAERRSLAARATANPAAYDQAMRGDFFLARRNGADARRALGAYESAVRLDPSFSRAFGRIGLSYFLFIDWGWPYPGLTFDSLLARGFAATDRGLAADSGNAEAWVARGLLLSYRDMRTLAGAIPALQRAVALDPRNAEAWHQLAGALCEVHRDAEAIPAYERSLALDPQRMITLGNYGWLLALRGQHAEARLLLDSAQAANPDAYYPHLVRGRFRLKIGDVAGARADADAVRRLLPADVPHDGDDLQVGVRVAEGDSAAARGIAEAQVANATADGSHLLLITAASSLVYIGQHDRALALLERSRPFGIKAWYIMRDPALNPLRADPRFQRLLDELRPR